LSLILYAHGLLDVFGVLIHQGREGIITQFVICFCF